MKALEHNSSKYRFIIRLSYLLSYLRRQELQPNDTDSLNRLPQRDHSPDVTSPRVPKCEDYTVVPVSKAPAQFQTTVVPPPPPLKRKPIRCSGLLEVSLAITPHTNAISSLFLLSASGCLRCWNFDVVSQMMTELGLRSLLWKIVKRLCASPS